MTSQQPLFEQAEFVASERPGGEVETPVSRPRLRLPVRDQVLMRCEALDELIPAEHVARALWAYMLRLDLAPLLADVSDQRGKLGHPTDRRQPSPPLPNPTPPPTHTTALHSNSSTPYPARKIHRLRAFQS